MNGPSLTNPKKISIKAPVIGGFVPFSTVDWPGKLAAIIFISGCPWRCHYCHNPHLQSRQPQESWEAILARLSQRKGLLDGVVLSGGEPLIEQACKSLVLALRALDFEVAIHTAGIYPTRLSALLPELSWVALDVKTTESAYDRLTGKQSSYALTDQSLNILLDWGGPFECRTTWSPDWLSERELIDLAQSLSARGVREYALQRFRNIKSQESPVSLSASSLHTLQGLFNKFTYR